MNAVSPIPARLTESESAAIGAPNVGTTNTLGGPDAELIRLCEEHVANLCAYCGSAFDGEFENDPLWHAYERTRDAMHDAKPQTIEGMLAKARATKAEALGVDGKDREPPFHCPADHWAWDLVNDLLRLNGAAPAGEADNPDAALIGLCDEFHELEQTRLDSFKLFPQTIEGDRAGDAYRVPMDRRQKEIGEAIDELPNPVTIAGLRAVSRALAIAARDVLRGTMSDLSDNECILLQKLVPGVLGMPA